MGEANSAILIIKQNAVMVMLCKGAHFSTEVVATGYISVGAEIMAAVTEEM